MPFTHLLTQALAISNCGVTDSESHNRNNDIAQKQLGILPRKGKQGRKALARVQDGQVTQRLYQRRLIPPSTTGIQETLIECRIALQPPRKFKLRESSPFLVGILRGSIV